MINKDLPPELKKDCLFLDLKDLPYPLEYSMIHYFTTRLIEEAFKTNIAIENKELLEINTFLTYNKEKLFINDKGEIECSFINNTEKLNSFKNKTVNKIIKELKKRIITIKTTDTIYKKLGLDVIVEKLKELQDREKEVENREKELSKKGKFKRPGHLTDQMLKYTYPKKNNKQLSIFDSLGDTTKIDIDKTGVERTEVVEGIKLSFSETKLIDSLCKLLHENSQTLDPAKEDYYTGNLPSELTDYSGERTVAPKLAFTLYELTQEYKGEDKISGKDLENVRTVLTDLDNRKFLIKYTETTKGKKNSWVKKEYEAYRKLIFVDKATLSYGIGDIENYKKTEIIVSLNPIFRRQIDSKFILYPNDIQKRTAIAYGNEKISSSSLRLRDYLMREHSSKRYTPEIGLDKLYYLLAEQYMKESRKKKVKEVTDKAIETVKALGLLLKYEIVQGQTGEHKVIFTLNKDWE